MTSPPPSTAAPVLVSACLLGLACRYDGASEPLHTEIKELIALGVPLLPVCPEQLGGLPTPRPASDFAHPDITGDSLADGHGRIINAVGDDVTPNFIRGAEETLKIARLFGAKKAFLRRRSPSCGFRKTYARGKVVNGNGVAAAILAREGLEIHPLGGEE